MKEEIIEWIKVIIFSVAIALVITTFARPTIVEGESMYPTLDHRNILLVNQFSYKTKEPSYGDIIVFKSDIEVEGKKIELIKRVIAVAGDQVTVEGGRVLINDEELTEPYIPQTVSTPGLLDIVVPDGHIFVLGDNRFNSTDSRNLKVGPVSLDKVVGKAYLRLYPFDVMGAVE